MAVAESDIGIRLTIRSVHKRSNRRSRSAMRLGRVVALICGFVAAGNSLVQAEEVPERADVIVYGGTSGGIAAAIQISRMDRSVILIEPSSHLGGLTSGGLGATDIGNKAAIGGISREFYQRVKEHYDQDAAWTFESQEDYRSRRFNPNDDAMWTFEPSVAEKIYEAMLSETSVILVREERLDRDSGVELDDGRIVQITTESGRSFQGDIFIDATYEGDLLAAAGVSYHVGRESNATYGETLNGQQIAQSVHHQFAGPVDPYVEPGNPSSGLLPGIDTAPPAEDGTGDHRVQAYCFRMCVTDVEENRIEFEKPDDYDPLQYELLLRNFEAGADRAPWNPILMPNRKTDANNNRGVSTDYIGMNYEWPEADYDTRREIYDKHLSYQRGLMWTLANHPRVPRAIRDEVSRWGNCKDEFIENGGWSHQLYVREGRRMVGMYVMTQLDCQGGRMCSDAVGLAAYTMDSHNVQRYIDDQGHVRNEGDVQVGGFSPYPISYRSLVPHPDEVTNLLVPVALSASHIAYGSIRMEPVFMVLGQSTGTAACHALDQGTTVQDVDYERLAKRLEQDGQVLAWTGPRIAPIRVVDPSKLTGVVVDDVQAKKSAGWTSSRSVGGLVGTFYLHDGNDAKGDLWIEFEADVEHDGEYEICVAYTPHGNRATNVPVELRIGDYRERVRIDQTAQPPIMESFCSIGEFSLSADDRVLVRITNEETDGFVVVDAIWLKPIDD